MADSSDDVVIIDITAKFTDQATPAIDATQQKLNGFMATVQKLTDAMDKLNSTSGSMGAFDKAQADADKLDSSTQKLTDDTDKLGQTQVPGTIFTSAESSSDKFTQAVQKSQKAVDDLGRKKAQPEVSLKDSASKVLKDISSGIKTVADKTFSFTVKAIDMATSPLRSIFNFATSLKGILTGIATGAAVKGTILDPIALADSYKNAEIGFDTMLGSAQKGQQMMQQIQQFAIATPFSTSDVVKNTQTMMAYGFQAKDVIADMKIIGDQAAATGRGADGLNEIALALGQMQAHGKVDAQDMNQLTSAGVKGWDYLAQSMGKTKAQVMDMSDKGLIPASEGVQAILNGMKEYDGMMDKMANSTATGLLSQIKDTFSIDILTKWGQGLQKGVVGGLSQFNDWLGKNQDKIAKWGDALESIGATISTAVTAKVEALGDRVNSVVNSDAFQKAGTLSDKIHILWDQVIVAPFDEWWQSKGQKWMSDKAKGLGKGIGSALSGGLLAILGITNPDAASSGASVGQSFVEGFSQTFNGKKIGELFLKDLKSIIGDAAKLLPGGKDADSTSWISAAALGYAGIKVGSGAVKAGKGIGTFAKDVGGLAGAVKKKFGKGASKAAKAAAGAVESYAVETMTVNAAVVNINGDIVRGGGSGASESAAAQDLKSAESNGGQVLLDDTRGASKKATTASKEAEVVGETAEDGAKSGKGIGGFFKKIFSGKGASSASAVASDAGEAATVASDVGKLGKVAEIAGKFGKAAPIVGTALAVVGGVAEVASAPKSQKVRAGVGAAGNVAGGLAGAAAGAQLGALAGGAIGSVVPGVGNAIGAGIGGAVGAVGGGIAGAVGGEKAVTAIYDKRDDIGKGIGAAGKAVGDFFTKTIPGAASATVKATGGFITGTIPSAASAAGNAVGNFFTKTLPYSAGKMVGTAGAFVTKTIPHAAEAAGAAVGTFLTKTAPYAVGKAIGQAGGAIQKFATKTVPAVAGAVGGFFTKTLPGAATKVKDGAAALVTKTVIPAVQTAGNAVGGFFTKTLPSAASKAASAVGTFVTKTVPGAASEAGAAVGGFFTKTLPSAATKAASAVGTFVTKTVPGAAQEAGNAVGGFFTKTLPSAASTVATTAEGFVTKTIPSAASAIGSAVSGFFTKTLPDAVSSALDGAKKFFGSIGNGVKSAWNSFTSGVSAGYNQTSAHASGGIFDRPHVGLVAEAGPEAIIPLSSGRRSRGMELWQRAGQALGVRQYADGGIAGAVAPVIPIESAKQSKTSVSTPVEVTVSGNSFQFTVEASSGSSDDIVAAIKSQTPQIANEIALEISKGLKTVFPNIPIGA